MNINLLKRAKIKLSLMMTFCFLCLNISAQNCLPTGISFATQAEIDAFPNNFPSCTTIQGDVTISGIGISNLNGLAQLISIGGNFEVSNNDDLLSLEGLSSLTSLGGELNINFNSSLTSLSGLENIDPNSVAGINIFLNFQLSSCAVESICLALELPGTTTNISNNAPGCNSLAEVEAACPSCPVAGIDFTDQTQIDNFSTNYPNCTTIQGDVTIAGNTITNLNGLSQLTTIEGDLLIWIQNVVQNLDGLSNLTTIGGDFSFQDNHIITNLNGFSSLTTVGGGLQIGNCTALLNLDGFSSLTTVLGALRIRYNDLLTEVSGFSNLVSIGDDLELESNFALLNLGGLSDLTTVGGDISSAVSSSLTNFAGLSGLTAIGGGISMESNHALTSLSGLEYIDPNTIASIYISNNSQLSSCAIESICLALGLPGTTTNISNNATGCNSIVEVEAACPSCPAAGINLTTQASIDDFSTNYPNCTTIQGDVTIQGSGIFNLNGLAQITSIEGNLNILSTENVLDVDGLSGLMTIGGILRIDFNTVLQNLDGFSNLTSIDGYLNILFNPALSDVSGLSGLTTIGGYLNIQFNIALTNLSGLENINPSTIVASSGEDIRITNNPQLSSCAVESICLALDLPGTTTDISDNATGCNTESEIDAACSALPVSWTKPLTGKLQDKQSLLTWSVADQIDNDLFVVEHSADGRTYMAIGGFSGEGNLDLEKTYYFTHEKLVFGSNYYRVKQVDYDGQYSYSNVAEVKYESGVTMLHPNPTMDYVFIKSEIDNVLSIYNLSSQLMEKRSINIGFNKIDLSDYRAGLYIFRMENGEVWKVGKK